MTDAVRRSALALLLAALLVASAVAGGASAQAQTTPPDPADGDSPSPADDVYVTDDGDVIYVYESDDSREETADGQFGMSTEENLAYVLLTDTVESPPDVTWNVSALAQPESLTAEGNLSAPRPPALESLDVSLTSRATPEDARSDFDLAATFGGQAGYGRLLQSLTTDGEVTMGPDRFYATGDFAVESVMPMGESSSSSLSFREVTDGYELTASQNRVLRTPRADTVQNESAPRADARQNAAASRTDAWANESAARATIRDQYVPTNVSELSGSADVSLDTYSLTNVTGGKRLDVSYTITYTDMDESLQELIARELSQPPGATREAADRLAEALLAATVEEVSFATSSAGGTVDGNATVAVSDYRDVALAYFEYAESIQPDAAASANLDQARAQFEAQQAAGLEQRYTWSGEVQGSQNGSLSVDVAFDYRTSNWAAFVDELRNRDVPWSESRYALNGTTEGQQIAVEGSMRLQGEDLWEGALGQLGTMGTGETAEADWGQALVASQPETARLVGSYDADGLRVEAGAAFGNLSALRDAVADASEVPPADEIVGRNGTTHVRVNGALSGDVAESDVRALPTVDDETTVHLPGTWDREFASMDADRASAFLNSAGSSGPGFGVALALVALLAVAAFAARRD